MPVTKKSFSDMTTIEKWQHMLRRKFQQAENAYYPIVDDLTQKLWDLEVHTNDGPLAMPDFNIHIFSFIKEWQDGDMSSQAVYAILKTMNMGQVGETQLTRRFQNYLIGKENSIVGDYVIPCIALIKQKAVPAYVQYLQLLTRYFEKLVEIDKTQEKITWIEKVNHADKRVSKKIEDLTLNQVIRQLDTQVIPFNNHRYTVGENLICLDEDMADGAYAMHWLFAPKQYILALKSEFKIHDVMDIEQESRYIKDLMGSYINEKV